MPVITHNGVLVAGGSGALGAAVLHALLDAGHTVTSTWIVDAERDRIASAFPAADRLTLLKADVTDPDDVDQVVAAVQDLGAVVNLVGGYDAPGASTKPTPQTSSGCSDSTCYPSSCSPGRRSPG